MEHGTRRWLAAAAPLIAIACAGERYALVGFPLGPTSSARESSEKLQGGIREIEADLNRDAGTASAPAADVLASRRLLDAYVALAADEIGTKTGLLPFNYPERRQPLFLYPRITFPHIAECSTAPVAADGAAPEPAWLVPVLLNRAALKESDPYSVLFGSALSAGIRTIRKSPFDTTYTNLYNMMKERFHVALVPRGDRWDSEIALDDGKARWIEPRGVTIGGGTDRYFAGPFHLPLGRPDAVDFAFELPASALADRWERKAKETGRPVNGEIFDLRLFPRIPFESSLPAPQFQQFLTALRGGNWVGAYKVLESIGREYQAGERLSPERMASFRKSGPEMRAAANAIRAFVRNYAWFEEALAPIADRIDRIADEADDPTIRKGGEVADEALRRIRDLQMVIGKFLADDPSPAPVFLDEPNPKNRDFSFIVGADLQYDTDASCLQQFLAIIDETRIPGGITKDPNAIFAAAAREARGAKFVVIVGDFGDGKGLSSSPTAALGDSLGLSSPTSPYAEHSTTPHKGEFPELREMIRKSRHPIFVVPGNHDGFVNYGGILNQLTLFTGRILQWIPLIGFLGDPLVNVSDDLPVLVKIWRISPPFYDGLIDWSLELGPRNLAFHYRGSAFVAVNSFDLEQFARDQVGALANNWGGGVQDTTLAWVEASLQHFSQLDRAARGLPPAEGTSFVFMHHDPRAGIASKNGYVEKDFGHYNDVTSPMTEITFGYLGTSSALYTNLWIPILSPIATGAIRSWTYGENFQERWMRSTAWDTDCYNAKGLIDIINRNLEGAPPTVDRFSNTKIPSARISHLFFGHDDVPVESEWVHPNGNAVFPEQPSDADWSGLGYELGGFFFRLQSHNAPDWASGMHFDDGRQAKVERLDDLGDAFSGVNTHGFSLVTVHPAEPGAASRPAADVRWIPIPR
jgi:hypothetical protein